MKIYIKQAVVLLAKVASVTLAIILTSSPIMAMPNYLAL